MAEVVLNLKYNDNGAEGKINSIIRSLQQVEAKDWKLKVNIDEAAVNHQFANIQRTGAAAIQGLKRAWSDYKSIVEAPLNLTGVNQLVSLLDKMEGSLLLNQISSNITSGFANSLERYDILQTYPKIIESIGYSSKDASDSMDRLYQSVLGLPTAFGDIVNSAQYFTLILDDLEKGTNLAIAANNAFVASGATGQQVTAGMRQLQYIMEGTKLRSTQWYSLIRSMPIALREVGDALGYPDFKSFTEDLIANKVASEDFIDTLIDVGLNSEKLGNLLDTMKDRAVAALTNVRNAAMRMGEGWLTTLDKTLEETGGKGLVDNIKGVSSIIDHIAEVGRTWIETHGTELQSLIDKFMAIKWDELIPKLFDSLTYIADTALGNIDEWLLKIPDILQDVRATFNALDNSRLLKILEVLGTGVTTGATAGILAKLFGGSALFGGGASAVAGSAGIGVAGIGAAGIGAAIGTAIANIVDLIYQIADKGWKNGTNEYLSHWEWMNPAVYAYNRLRDFSIESGANSGLLEHTFGWLKDQIELLDENGLFNQYRLRNLSADKIQALRDRYGSYSFANESWMNVLDLLKTGLLVLPTDEYDSDINTLNYDISRLTSSMNLADVIAKPYDDAINALESKKDGILKEIDSINEEIGKKFAGVDVNIFTFYKSIYAKGKKYFSEQFKEASDWGYSNTTKDRADFLEKNLPKIEKTIGDITEYALENYKDDEAVMAVVAQFLADFNWNDPDQLAVLVKNYGGKSMQEVFTMYFEQQARNLNLDEAIETARLNAQLLLKKGELEGINIQQSDLEQQKESALAPIIEMIEDDMEILQDDFANVIYGTQRSSEQIVNTMEHIFDSLSSEKPEKDINSFFSNIYNTIKKWSRLIPVAMSSVRQSSYNSNLINQGYYSANGGLTPRGTDTIPAMLTPGEYVQRRAAVQHFGRTFMDRINALDLHGALNAFYSSPYATGGFVRSDNRSYRDNHAVVNQVFNSGNASTGFRRASRFVRALG